MGRAEEPQPDSGIVVLAAASGLAAGGWIGAADGCRAALFAPRPFTPADFAAVLVLWAAAGLALGALAGVAAAVLRWTPARARLLPAHLLAFAFLAAWAATRLLPRSLATPSLALNALLALAAVAGLAALARLSWRRLLPRAAAPAARPGRALLLGGLPLAAAWIPWIAGPGLPPPRDPAPGPAPNVLVVLVDSVRADRLGAFGSERGLTPRLDAFAADAAAFPETRTSSTWTKPSMTSLLTGLRPERHGMMDAGDVLAPGTATLHTLLGGAGWRTAVFSDSHWPVPEFGFQRGVDGEMVVPDAGGIRGSLPWAAWALGSNFLLESYATGTPAPIRGAPELGRRFLAWADEEDPRPWCAYLHWMEPHHPYAPERPSEPGRRRLPVPVHLGVHPFDRGTPIPAADLRDLEANYDDEVRAADGAFGGLLDGLAARGWTDRTVIVFLSDHGEEFFEHGGWTHEHSLCEEVVRVPLLIRAPGGPAAPGRGVRVPGQVRIEDVLPTILDLAGAPIPASLDGATLRPLLAGGAGPPRPSTGLCRRTGAGTVVRSAVLDGWKFLLGTRGPLRVERFFDLARDPGEVRPVEAPPPDRARALRRLVAEAEAIEAARSGPERTALPSEMLRGVEGLGYIGSPPAR